MNKIENTYFQSIFRFMKLKSFVGLVGGEPNLAYYFCGFIE
jgi:hypothetical protein